MPSSIKQIQGELARFDHAARKTESPVAFKALWKRIFHKELSDAAAKSFARYYKEMRSKTGKTVKHHKTQRGGARRQRGGAAYTLPSAPVNYAGTVPGLLTETYGQFPVEVDMDPASIRDLDVYFHDSLPLSRPGFWPTVPADMGSNKVGGDRTKRVKHGRKTYRQAKRGEASRRQAKRGEAKRRASRKQRGGNLLDSLAMRPFPFAASAPPNTIQSLSNSFSGGTTPVPSPSSPVNYTWNLGGSTGVPINPGLVSNIGSDFSRSTVPPLWQNSS